jgi:DsbC/DsbD-like thiol-disulfide interchange protein
MVLALVVSPVFAVTALAQNQTFQDVVKKVEARVDSASAKRGETVKWSLTVEIADGWHTYPTKQNDPKADSYVNKIKFANQGGAIFVGELKEPATVERKEDEANISIVEGSGTWQRAIVISPDAKPGKIKIQVPIKILACADRCLPPQTVTTEVELTISDDPAVPVDPKYRKEVNAAKK